MKKQERYDKIDELAVKICTLMSPDQKMEFFEYREERQKSGEGLKKKYFAGRTYYKGKRKGQEREVFDVDGKGFNELWELLLPIAKKAVWGFFMTRKMFNWDEEEVLFDIKYQTLYVLRFFGGRAYDFPFSRTFYTICTNLLNTECRRRYGNNDKELSKEEGDALILSGKDKNLEWDEEKECYIKRGMPANKTRVNYKSVSLFNDVMIEDDDAGWSITYLPSNNHEFENIEFQACIPENLAEIVNYVVDGYSLKETAKLTGRETVEIKNLLKDFAVDFCN